MLFRSVGEDEINPFSPTRPITNECELFVEEDLTYNGCVENHQYDSDFYRNSWRIYLESSKLLWREEREIIKLLDQHGRTVDVIEY